MSAESPEMSTGEIARTLARIEGDLKDFRVEARDRSHALANQLNIGLGQVAGHAVRLDGLDKRADAHADLMLTLGKDVQTVTGKANFISGCWSAVTIAIGLGIAWFKGR